MIILSIKHSIPNSKKDKHQYPTKKDLCPNIAMLGIQDNTIHHDR